MTLAQAQPLSQITKEIDKVKGKKRHLPKSVRKNFNEGSLEVLNHFGIDAPFLLNEYSCSLEDELIEQVKRNKFLEKKVAILSRELVKVQLKLRKEDKM
jgi:hypothetical protein